jgi:hypothetical protein
VGGGGSTPCTPQLRPLPHTHLPHHYHTHTRTHSTYTSKCGNGDFYVKTDDDVFVYPWRLRRRLEKVDFDQAMYGTHLGVYIGNFWVDSRPIRETWHKNYEPKWKGEHFGPYAAGPFYILSKSACDFVGDNALSLNWKWKNEDMAMGTWMAGADVEFANDWHIKILNWKHFEHPLIAEHNIDVSEAGGGRGPGAALPSIPQTLLTLTPPHTHSTMHDTNTPTCSTGR